MHLKSNAHSVACIKILVVICSLFLIIKKKGFSVQVGERDNIKSATGVESSLEKKDSTNKKSIVSSDFLVDDNIDTNYKPAFNDSIVYSSKDSATLNIKEGSIKLYKKSTAKYDNIETSGEEIDFNHKSMNLTLLPLLDSNKNIKLDGKTRFKESSSEYLSDTVIFNLESKKGIVKNSFTTQGDMYIWGKRLKKIDENSVFASDVRFTTCQLSSPHFAFKSSKGKFKKGKVGVTNAIYPEFENVSFNFPIFPFSMFPIYAGTRSGFIAPQFIQTYDRGFGLTDGGYYFTINDYIDLVLKGELFSFGSWQVFGISSYKKRYSYNGSINLAYSNLILGFPGDTVRDLNKMYRISINHNTDPKSMPNKSFSVRIDLRSSEYNKYVLNNPAQNFENQINSSISYTQRWKKTPISISIYGSHNQNNATKQINVSLPNINISVQNFNPFENIGKSSTSWYKKTSIKYDGNMTSNTNFYDSLIMPLVEKNFRWGIKHSPSISLPLPPLGPFIFNPGISYSEIWTDRKTTIKTKNVEDNSKYDTTVEKGIYRFYEMNYSAGVATNVYGTWLYGNKFLIRGIRNVIRPSLSFSYKPNLNSHNYYDLNNPNGTITRKNYYEDAVNSFYTENKNMSLNFSVSSSLEMKVKNSKDTVTGTKNISLIDNFSLSGSYNLTKDTLNKKPLSNINLNLTTRLTDKINLNGVGTFDPYGFDTTGNSIEKYAWQQKKMSLGRLTNFSIYTSISFSSKGGKKSNTDSKILPRISPEEKAVIDFLYHDTSLKSDYRNYFNNWSVSISYNVSYISKFNSTKKDHEYTLGSHNVNISGNISTTPNWRLDYRTSINLPDFRLSMIKKIQINTLSFSVSRDLHCWEINMNIIPFGLVKSISFVLRPKSGIFRDIKVEKNRSYYNN